MIKLIEEIIQKSDSHVITFPCKWDTKYHQVIDEVLGYLQGYYSKAKNCSAEFGNYLNQNGFSAGGIKLRRVPRQKSAAMFHMIGRYTRSNILHSKSGKKSQLAGKMILKRINTSLISSNVTYHLTFEVKDFSKGDRFSAEVDISGKEAKSFSEYAKREYGIIVRNTGKAFY